MVSLFGLMGSQEYSYGLLLSFYMLVLSARFDGMVSHMGGWLRLLIA